MTRINVGIRATELNNLHLNAEHREIKRIPNAVRTGKARIENIPEQFTLGTGHVKFFYNKLGYLLTRYKELYQECKHRGINVQDYSSAWEDIPEHLMGEYEETERDREIIQERIMERLTNK